MEEKKGIDNNKPKTQMDKNKGYQFEERPKTAKRREMPVKTNNQTDAWGRDNFDELDDLGDNFSKKSG